MPAVTPQRSTAVRVFSRILWTVAGLAVLPAAVCIVDAFFAQAAPGQGAAAAVACALVIVPYVLARAWDELTRIE